MQAAVLCSRLHALPLGTADNHGSQPPEVDIEKELATLPRPRKHSPSDLWCTHVLSVDRYAGLGTERGCTPQELGSWLSGYLHRKGGALRRNYTRKEPHNSKCLFDRSRIDCSVVHNRRFVDGADLSLFYAYIGAPLWSMRAQ
jgi:hypothetical protein